MVSAAAVLGDGVTGMLLVLLCASHASASCGIQKVNVVEASEEGLVSEKEFPWVVSLQNSHHTHLAFGSILSAFWILSIASAFQNRKDAVAIVGIARMNARVISHQEYPINTIIIHEDFDNKTMVNNVALLKTDTAMQFNSLVRPVCFLSRKLHKQLALRNCWVAGWNPTFATGNRMTMSILRKIFVKDMDLCPSNKLLKRGCGNHVEEETHTVCLGDPGNPLMCQLQGSDLWVLRGLLSQGGEKCPGLFLYIKVEDYSKWITSKTNMNSLLLSAFYHRENSVTSYSPSTPTTAVTQEQYSTLSQVSWTETQSQTQLQTQTEVTIFMAGTPWLENSSEESIESRGKGITELGSISESSVQSTHYSYYDDHVGEGESVSHQNGLHQPQAMILVSSVLVSFVMVDRS
ncbi:inactive serine protease 54 isoform 1-T2 [Molossus nigricans]